MRFSSVSNVLKRTSTKKAFNFDTVQITWPPSLILKRCCAIPITSQIACKVNWENLDFLTLRQRTSNDFEEIVTKKNIKKVKI